jgi:hypothetical protein
LIPVAVQPEPLDFQVKVRARGSAFLRRRPHPTTGDFKQNNYWKECLPQLYAAYGGICAYSASYLPTEHSLDHFLPKIQNPTHAYEWNNYRLASPRLNSHKGDSPDVLDPFQILPDWFVLNLTNFWIEPNVNLEPRIEAKVRKTIVVLRLNSDDIFVRNRFRVVREYAMGLTNFDFLKLNYPFIAYELERQNQQEAIKATFP